MDLFYFILQLSYISTTLYIFSLFAISDFHRYWLDYELASHIIRDYYSVKVFQNNFSIYSF